MHAHIQPYHKTSTYGSLMHHHHFTIPERKEKINVEKQNPQQISRKTNKMKYHSERNKKRTKSKKNLLFYLLSLCFSPVSQCNFYFCLRHVVNRSQFIFHCRSFFLLLLLFNALWLCLFFPYLKFIYFFFCCGWDVRYFSLTFTTANKINDVWHTHTKMHNIK